jgi:hypothetical protein
MNSSDPGRTPQIRPVSIDEIATKMSSAGRSLKPKDLEAIQRLWRAGARQAAMKLYSGAMDCGMSAAAEALKRLDPEAD